MVSPKLQNILAVVVVLLLLVFLGYKTYTREPEILVADTILSDTDRAGQEIIALVDKLNTVSIDQDLFSSELFNNLKDFSQAIYPEVRGRVNPFALIGADGSSSLKSQTQLVNSNVSQ